jgi:hypothetical protein
MDLDKYTLYFPLVEMFFEGWPCIQVNIVSCGPSEVLCVWIEYSRGDWEWSVISSFVITNNRVCVLVVPALYAVEPFVQYLQNEGYCSQNNAKTEHQECWEDVLQANTGKASNITTAFRLLRNPVLVFSIRYATLL